ncbi:hypothetical protein [Kiritimatiella glycovorans]|uniref:Uncharacterized protein n=1 Tax=Kiritimatiella glycovorans TaxID=1307763 RepID=A0A0G3EL59_9BACT|nr:hypothetical protein [Kiritimatiella glycovorans]AKJ64864.1 hypothetical protein L21SP4_01621 [Kiritimatiella glycovorans]
MMLETIRIWTVILLLIDGSLGVLMSDRWQERIPMIRLARMGWIEIAAAMVLLLIHIRVTA